MIPVKWIPLIAEVKTQSPFGYRSKDSWDKQFKLAHEIGDIVSIHTDPRWGRSFELLKRARKLCKKPILAKGIHSDDDQIMRAVNLGADCVLVVGRIPKVHLSKCWIEPNSIHELTKVPVKFPVVWNSRDLLTGGFKSDGFKVARDNFTGWMCQASNIADREDIHPKADAVLIGTHLKKFRAVA